MYKLLAQSPINNPVLPGIANKSPEAAPELLGNFLGKLVGVLLVFATIFALAQLLQGGIGWITSGGEKANLDQSRDRITNALIGLVLVFAAWSLYIVILRFLGISLIGESGNVILNLPSLTQ